MRRGRGRLLAAAAGILLALFMAGRAPGAEDPAAAGARLVEAHRYGEAIAALRPHLASGPAGQRRTAALTLGAAFLRNAALHRSLHRFSVAVQIDYLGRLSREGGKGGSALASLYLGESLLAAGRSGEAKGRLERFLAGPGGKTSEGSYARIGLALAHHRLGETGRATELWESVGTGDPAAAAALAAARLEAGVMEKEAAAEACDAALAALRRTGKRLPPRAVAAALAIYGAAGQVEKGLDLAAAADLSAFSREEVLGKHKAVRFYDARLLEALATLYGRAAVAWLSRATAEAQAGDAARLLLAEAYDLLGRREEAARTIDAVLAGTRAAPRFRDRAAVRRAALRYAAGRKEEAVRSWEDLSRKPPPDPDLLAEVVAACARTGAPCAGTVARAEAAAEAGERRRARALNAALGRYRLARKEAPRALAHLEAARDKGNKNRIEFNDPEVLVDLAEAYFRVREFSEAQEILFALGKSLPAARQVQEALQGVYAREQKSAGDARIL